jgi:hypothetical protein
MTKPPPDIYELSKRAHRGESDSFKPLYEGKTWSAINSIPRQSGSGGDLRSTALMQPSFSGLFVTWAYFPKTTLPPAVTMPSSDTLTSMTVPLVSTPREV